MPSRSWADRAAAVALVAVLAAVAGTGCGPSEPSGDARLSVYVSLPLRGPSGPDGLDAADGARLALGQAGGRAGGIAVEVDVRDDTAARRGGVGWTPAAAAANARRALEDSTAIAYIGELESGATRASLPVTNAAGLLQVSPGSGASDLVAPFPGSNEVPETQPSGERSFGRVIPSDVRQAEAAAAWVDRLGVQTIGTLSDGSRYGDEVLTAFRDAVERATVTRRGIDWLFYAGQPGSEPASLVTTIGHLLVTDAQLGAAARTQPPGTLATSAALDPSQLRGGEQLRRDFEAEFGRPPGRYAAYGYEAMAVILDSIERAQDPLDRGSVVDAFFATAGRESVLGRYSIDELGETTLDRMTGYRIEGGRPVAVAELRAGP